MPPRACLAHVTRRRRPRRSCSRKSPGALAEHGDAVDQRGARQCERRPAATLRQLVAQPADHLNAADLPHVAKVEIVGLELLNFRLHEAWLTKRCVVIAGGVDDYARPTSGMALAMIEFVSANLTGPLHVGNGVRAEWLRARPPVRQHRPRRQPRTT